jgi:hypothetical protein
MQEAEPIVDPIVEPIVTDKSSENVHNSENSVENVENAKEPVKKGRPAGSKDKAKRVVPSRKKITIIEEPLSAPTSSSSAPAPVPEAPKAKAAKPKVQINPEPVIHYVDRFVEHSPRSMMTLMTNHAMDLEKAKKDARREHFSNAITSRLRQLP